MQARKFKTACKWLRRTLTGLLCNLIYILNHVLQCSNHERRDTVHWQCSNSTLDISQTELLVEKERCITLKATLFFQRWRHTHLWSQTWAPCFTLFHNNKRSKLKSMDSSRISYSHVRLLRRPRGITTLFQSYDEERQSLNCFTELPDSTMQTFQATQTLSNQMEGQSHFREWFSKYPRHRACRAGNISK